MIEYRYTREFRRAAIAACAQKFTAVLNLVQPTGDQSKETAVIVVATTATATKGNQQLSLLQICHDSLFAHTKMRGGDDGLLSFARVPCPLLPFLLVILLPLLPLPPAAHL